MEQGYTAARIEPPLEELLNDPIAQLLMRRDGIALADVWRAVELARSRLANRAQKAAQDPTVELLPNVEADSHPTSPSG